MLLDAWFRYLSFFFTDTKQICKVALMVVFSLFFFIMYAVSYFYRFDDSLPKLHTHICSGFSQ